MRLIFFSGVPLKVVISRQRRWIAVAVTGRDHEAEVAPDLPIAEET